MLEARAATNNIQRKKVKTKLLDELADGSVTVVDKAEDGLLEREC